jgi:uncharacterized alpha-E superfamily protein
LSSLLARFAENIFWLARYLERAENLARILDINETYARDNPEGPDWKRVLVLNGDLKRYVESNETIDERGVLSFYVNDRSNPTSILSCIGQARENARSVRHLISTEMWTQINILHAQVRSIKARDIRTATLSPTARRIILGCQAFEGIAEGTFFRGEPWLFYHLGKYVERADQTTRILDMGCDRLFIEEGDAVAWVHWNVMLRSVSGYHAFCACHPAATSPQEIAAFLLYDTEFPRAVTLCIARLTERLRDIEKRPGHRRKAPVESARKEIEALLEGAQGQKLSAGRLHAHLDKLQSALAAFSKQVEISFFDAEREAV